MTGSERRFDVGYLSVATWIAAVALFLAHLFLLQKGTGALEFFGINALPELFIAVGVLLAAGRVRGAVVWRRTPIDVFFVGWLFLFVASQLYASIVLRRTLAPEDSASLLSTIVMLWVDYRAVVAIVLFSPRHGSRAALAAWLGAVAIGSTIGILQGVGPLRNWALVFGARWGSEDTNYSLIGAETARSFGLFGWPVRLGFLSVLGAGVVIAAAVARGRRLSDAQAALALVGVLFFGAATLYAQSRQFLVVGLFLDAGYVVYLFRIRRWRPAATGLALGALAVAAVLATRTESKSLTYLNQSLGDQSFRRDYSLELRARSFRAVVERADELATLGSGWTRVSMNTRVRNNDYFGPANSPDSSILQAYLAHGVFGVLLLLWLAALAVQTVRLSASNPSTAGRHATYAAAFGTAIWAVGLFGGVTYTNFQASMYIFSLWGIAAGSALLTALAPRLTPVPARVSEPLPAAP